MVLFPEEQLGWTLGLGMVRRREELMQLLQARQGSRENTAGDRGSRREPGDTADVLGRNPAWHPMASGACAY